MPIDRLENNWPSLVALVLKSLVSILSRAKQQAPAPPTRPPPPPPHPLTQFTCTKHTLPSPSISSFYTTTNASFASFAFYSASASSSSSPIHLPTSVTIAIASAADTSAGTRSLSEVKVHRSDDSRVYRRLLIQLEETERNFDEFWNVQLTRMQQCLELRRFEIAFRELQVSEAAAFPGESVADERRFSDKLRLASQESLGNDRNRRDGSTGRRAYLGNERISENVRGRHRPGKGSHFDW